VILIGAGVLAVATLLTFMLAGRTGEEMGKVGVQIRRMDKQLRSAKEKEKEVERIEHDLDIAREIQANLLPPKIPQIPGYDLYPFYRSAREVGGDYYDFFPIDGEHLAMVVADVSGKGIPGSMVMATTRMLLRILGPQARTASAILQQANSWVAKDIKRGMFVTAIFAVLNVHTRQMSVCSAGHNLGFDRGPIFDRTLQERRITLEAGDRVVMYTDGVVEAMSPAHEEYGDERFYVFVRDHARMRSKDFVLSLVRELDEHKGSAEQHDDITISTFRTLG
jgi:sigma-B regulation protein RsbU (phosphoserine phosphatase)